MADLTPHPGRRLPPEQPSRRARNEREGERDQVALRIGDAERDVAVRELGDHFAAGRIDGTEFDERASAALAARTQPQLDLLFADLPRPQPVRSRPPARPRGPYPMLAPVLVFLLLLFLIAASDGWVLIPLIWLWIATRWWRWAPPPRRG